MPVAIVINSTNKTRVFSWPKYRKKAVERITVGLRRFQPVLQSAKDRDINESDTVVIVADLLQDVFGYDKYAEITSEHMIRGTFCDLAVKIDGALSLLIEVEQNAESVQVHERV